MLEDRGAPYARGVIEPAVSPPLGAVDRCRAHGSVIYLQGVGGLRADWARPVREALQGLCVDIRAVPYADLLSTRGTVYARWDRVEAGPVGENARLDYVARQRRLSGLVDAVGESSYWPWLSSLPHPSVIADRLPLRHIVRSPFFGMDDLGRYLDDGARRAAVLARVSAFVRAAPRPRVILAHSLGSLVAWDLIGTPGMDIDLLITMGSPLALPFNESLDIAQGRAEFPYDRVGAWLNVVHLLDPVTAGRGLADHYPQACDVFLTPQSGLPATVGGLTRLATVAARAATSHLDSTYLASQTIAVALRDAMMVAPAGPAEAP